MLLSELTGIKNIKSLTPKELISYLDNLEGTSLKKLGAGANGAAFTDGQKAFKFWHRDSGYTKFLEFAAKHQDNEAIPKLYSKIRKLPFNITSDGRKGTLTGINYVKMELLKPLVGRHMRIFSDAGLKKLGLDKSQDKFDINRLSGPLIRDDITATMVDYIKMVFKNNQMEFHESDIDVNPYDLDSLFSLFNPSFVNLVETLKAIRGIMSDDEFPDLHTDNFAIRPSTGDLVILDPIANADDLDINSELWKD